jgi:nucleoid-associated protein YgaU
VGDGAAASGIETPTDETPANELDMTEPGVTEAAATEPGATGDEDVAAGADAGSEPEAGPFGSPPFRWIIAREGDTFEKIAERELGARALWRAVARANPLKDPRRLRAGDRVKVPLDPENPQARPEAPPEPPAPPPVVEYTVAPGDTLSGIAKKFYGSITFTDFLYDANRDRLANPDALRPGQVLVIPPPPADGPGG